MSVYMAGEPEWERTQAHQKPSLPVPREGEIVVNSRGANETW